MFQATVLKFGDFWGDGSWQQMQNFSTKLQKYAQLGQQNTGTLGVNSSHYK